jgi:hypothetical protein
LLFDRLPYYPVLLLVPRAHLAIVLFIFIVLFFLERIVLFLELHDHLQLLHLTLSALIDRTLALMDLSLQLLSDGLIGINQVMLVTHGLLHDFKIHCDFLSLMVLKVGVLGDLSVDVRYDLNYFLYHRIYNNLNFL